MCVCVECSGLVWLLSLVVRRQVPQNNLKIRLTVLLCDPHWLAPYLKHAAQENKKNNFSESGYCRGRAGVVPLHRAMRLVSYRRTATASKTTGKYGGDYIKLREVDRNKLISTLI